MSFYQTLKEADRVSKYAVFGYVNKCISTKQTIPDLVSWIVLLYYYQPEFLVPWNKNRFHLSSDKLTATNIDDRITSNWGDTINANRTIFGNRVINSMSNRKFKWTLTVNNIKKKHVVWFGFTTHFNLHFHCYYYCENDASYSLCNSGHGYLHGDNYHHGTPLLRFAVDKEASFTLILDLINGSILCEVNGLETVIFDNIKQSNKIQYKLKLQIPCEGGSITLKQFTMS
eukprot:253793_1